MKIIALAATLLPALVSGLLLSAPTLSAQNSGRPSRPHGMRPPPGSQDDQHRSALEQQFRQRSEAIVRKRLNLNDEQLTKLRSLNADIGGKRNTLVEQERSVRSGLRDEMAKGSGADQGRVSQLMQQAHDLQASRFTLQQDEQRQLSGFMSPIQVAQYVGLQAQIRQRIREMQRRPPDGDHDRNHDRNH